MTQITIVHYYLFKPSDINAVMLIIALIRETKGTCSAAGVVVGEISVGVEVVLGSISTGVVDFSCAFSGQICTIVCSIERWKV